MEAPRIVKIDRSDPFNPAKFLGQGWRIEEEDKLALALNEMDLTKVRFETMLVNREFSVIGEEKLRRLKKAGFVRLDAKVLLTLLQDPHLIPESWKDGKSLCFEGTVVRSPWDRRYVLYFSWNVRIRRWYWGHFWLFDHLSVYLPSAVLA